MARPKELNILSMGVSAQKAGRLEEACRHFEAAMQADPGNLEAPQLLGIALAAKGDKAGATAVFRQSAESHPRNPLAHFNLGLQLQSMGQHIEAITSFGRAVALHPKYTDAIYGLGFSYQKVGRHIEATAAYAKAARLDPKWVSALFTLGNSLAASGDLNGAIDAFRQAVAIKPGYLDALCHLGNALKAAGRLDEAVATYRQFLRGNPHSAPVLNNLGITLQEQGFVNEAVGILQQAVAVDPRYAEAHNSLAPALQRLNRIDEAIAACLMALEIDPSLGAAHSNLGNAYLALNDLPKAIEAFSTALQISPGDRVFRKNLGYAYLAGGRFRDAWPLYEERLHAASTNPIRNLGKPQWKGDADIRLKTLLVHSEQGLGDTIQFARFAAVLAQRGANVVLEVQPQLMTLLGAIDGPSLVIGKGDPIPSFDLHCPLLSLPLALGTDLDSIPRSAPYLRADPGKSARWDARFPRDPSRLRVGLVWSGQQRHKNDHNRSIPVALLRKLALSQRAQFFCLQNEIRESDRAALAGMPEITNVCQELASFGDTAALIDNMDLVISVDTSVAHLAGAMGKPTWIMLPFAADWRWMLTREDSPWYPSVRLFRQPCVGEWKPVISRLEAEITAF
jgi:tetratricopeptide (TPR) repeat protein